MVYLWKMMRIFTMVNRNLLEESTKKRRLTFADLDMEDLPSIEKRTQERGLTFSVLTKHDFVH